MVTLLIFLTSDVSELLKGKSPCFSVESMGTHLFISSHSSLQFVSEKQ